MNRIREKISVHGIVQGVGFRPFVYRLATAHRLAGFIKNDAEGVTIEIEGAPLRVGRFTRALLRKAPPLSRITDCSHENTQPLGDKQFRILESSKNGSATALISPDMSTCSDCLHELFDPADRRFRHPFINCTNCGPRFTIVDRIPYDRPNTSMGVFELCETCHAEYHAAGDRRFHAQPNACPACGPQLSLVNRNGESVETHDPIASAVRLLRAGRVVAVRGLGGFHLVVDAHNDSAVRLLRERKGRAQKPFALMAPNLESVRQYCTVTAEEAGMLEQQTRPIVLLKARKNHALAPSVAPDNRYLGFMLPYTPLHHLLLQDHCQTLVMTSANIAEEPIVIDNRDALENLPQLADYLLLHNREIRQRCDDSIVRMAGGEQRMIRRARGYVPEPVFLSVPTESRILACGGELKNTVALSRHNEVFLSQHIGNLDNPAAFAFFDNCIQHLQNVLAIKAEYLVCDLHPEYLSAKWARQQKLPLIAVQHHHAHLASVMAENHVSEPTIGIILDGTGYGTDGTIWGGEVLVGDYTDFDRFAWLQPVAMPGGEAAIRQPWRMALSYLHSCFGEHTQMLTLPFLASIPKDRKLLVSQMVDRNLNSPLTSSCGRLFDGVAALLGLRSEINFEAQAAIDFEMAIDDREYGEYKAALNASAGGGAIDIAPLIRAVIADVRGGVSVGRIAARFHRTLARLFTIVAEAARDASGINRVGLSGGVFQNRYFFEYLLCLLQERHFEVLTHKSVPANDGGLALGQIVIADAKIKQMRNDNVSGHPRQTD